jgi:DNA-binding transcriptional LysR family regulator
MQDMINPDMGEVSLGFLHTLGYSYIPDLIKGFIRKYPGIKFQLHQNNTPALVSQLTSGEVDFCILASINDIPRIEWTHLWSQELYVIVPAGHHLANDEEINLEQIADESLISFKEGYGIRKIIDDSLKKAGINPTVTFEGEEVRTVIGLVEAGLGVALIPDIKGIDRKKISMLHIKSPEVKREIGIAGISGQYLSPAALRFLKYVTEKFK